MKLNRIQYILQICIGVLLGVCLMKQEKYSEKLIQHNNAVVIQEYSNATNIAYENNEIFRNVNKCKNNLKNYYRELLTKSKREKIIVTKEDTIKQ